MKTPEVASAGPETPAARRSGVPCGPGEFALLSTEILRAGAGLRFVAHGASMLPLVRDGDVLIVRPADPAQVRVGDVVLCGREAVRMVAHRVIRITSRGGDRVFTLHGDNVVRPDGIVPAELICGRVVAIERHGIRTELDGAGMRLIGRAAALRTRLRSAGRASSAACRLVTRAARRIPALRRHLTE